MMTNHLLVLSLLQGPIAPADSAGPPRPAVEKIDRSDAAAYSQGASRTHQGAAEGVPSTSRSSDGRLRRGEGRGLVIGGAVVTGALHLTLHVWEGVMSWLIVPALPACVEGGPKEDPEDCNEMGVYYIIDFLVGMSINVSMSAGVGMMAAGLERHGAALRRRGARPGRLTPAQLEVRRKVGWGLFGAGMAVWALDAVHVGLSLSGLSPCMASSYAATCAYAVHMSSMFVGAGLVGAGVALGPFASGYLKEDARLGSLRVAPMTLRGGGGVLVGGRF